MGENGQESCHLRLFKKHGCSLIDPFWGAREAPGSGMGWQGDRQLFGDQPLGLRSPHTPPSKTWWGASTGVDPIPPLDPPIPAHGRVSQPIIPSRSGVSPWAPLLPRFAFPLLSPSSSSLAGRSGFEVTPKLSPMGRGGAEPLSLPFSGSLGGKCFQLKFQNGSSALSGGAGGGGGRGRAFFMNGCGRSCLSCSVTPPQPPNPLTKFPGALSN